RPRVIQQTFDLLVENRRVLELAFLSEFEQLVVGNAAPQEEGEPRSEFPIADAVDRARRALARIQLDTEQKVRGNQDGTERLLDAEVEVPGGASTAVEGEQRLEVGFGNLPAKCTAAQGRQDLARAGLFLRSARRMAHKNSSAAGSVAGTRDVIRSRDRGPGDLGRIRAFRNLKALQVCAIQPQVQLGH